MAAVWFRPDHVMPAFAACEAYLKLGQLAAAEGWVISCRRSNITRGWTYNSEILRVSQTEVRRYSPHGAGTGANPIEAMIDAVRLCGLKSPLILVTILECELWLLRQAAAEATRREQIQEALAAALDGLTEALRSINPAASVPDEDEDL